MRKYTFRLFILLVMLICAPTCGKDDQSDIQLEGNWTRLITGRLCTLNITSDNKWQVDFTNDSGTDVWGRITISGSQMIILDEGGAYMCSSLGIYEFALSENSLTFIVVNDPCDGRKTVIQGIWNRY